MTGLGVGMAVIAIFILVKSRVAFRDNSAVIEFQHSVAAVAIVFCLCDIPCSVVYWWRAVILPSPLSNVPESAREAQVGGGRRGRRGKGGGRGREKESNRAKE